MGIFIKPWDISTVRSKFLCTLNWYLVISENYSPALKSAYTIVVLVVNCVITDRLLNTLALFTKLGVIKGVVFITKTMSSLPLNLY